MIEIGLATFALAWALSLWYKLDGLRERLGVYFVYDGAGERADRVDGGGLGGWLNCPQCSCVLALPIVALLYWLWRPGCAALAGMGVALLAIRYWQSTRTKAEWWR